jgi:anti-sigma factor RsiW
MIPVALDVPGCEEIAEKLSELLDGELEPAAAARFALHLAVCPGCARLAVELDATIHALHRLARRTSRPAGVLH